MSGCYSTPPAPASSRLVVSLEGGRNNDQRPWTNLRTGELLRTILKKHKQLQNSRQNKVRMGFWEGKMVIFYIEFQPRKWSYQLKFGFNFLRLLVKREFSRKTHFWVGVLMKLFSIISPGDMRMWGSREDEKKDARELAGPESLAQWWVKNTGQGVRSSKVRPLPLFTLRLLTNCQNPQSSGFVCNSQLLSSSWGVRRHAPSQPHSRCFVNESWDWVQLLGPPPLPNCGKVSLRARGTDHQHQLYHLPVPSWELETEVHSLEVKSDHKFKLTNK